MYNFIIYVIYSHNEYAYIHIYMFMQDTYIYWIHTDTMNNRRSNKRRRKTSLTRFTSHFIARVRKGCVGFYCERELEIEHNCNILTPLLWPSRCVFLFLLMLNRSPGPTLLGAGFLYYSYQQLLWISNSIGVPEGPLGQVWLSLSHLVSNWLELYWQLPWLVKLNWLI